MAYPSLELCFVCIVIEGRSHNSPVFSVVQKVYLCVKLVLHCVLVFANILGDVVVGNTFTFIVNAGNLMLRFTKDGVPLADDTSV